MQAASTDSVVRVPLTRGFEAVIDAADAPLVLGRSWNAHVSTRTGKVYAAGRTGRGTPYEFMHNVILGVPPLTITDHRDCDGLNNRRQNLRVATHSQNNANRMKNSRSRSRFKGVYWEVAKGKWRVRPKLNGKFRHVGYFTDEAEAARAYDAAARELFGEFARLNFPEEAPLVVAQ